MASRTVETSPEMESALSFLAAEQKKAPDAFFVDKLNSLFTSLVTESNQKKYARAQDIMKTGDPTKIIPALKSLLD